MKKILASKAYATVEHAAKVAAFLAISSFLSSMLDQLTHSSLSATQVMIANVLLVSVIKYVNLHKAELGVQDETGKAEEAVSNN